MNEYCIARKPRRTREILFSEKLFSRFIQDKNHELVAKVVFWAVLKVGGVTGIMNALDGANSYLKRKDRIRGVSKHYE